MSSNRLAVLFTVVLGLSLTACTKNGGSSGNSANSAVNTKEILVGEYGAMTGGEATFGISTHEGVMMAIDKINADGGIKGKKIKIITVDDQGVPAEAATAVTKLITQDNVVAVLGEVASSNSLAAGTSAQEYKIPMITPASTNPDVTAKGDYIFRVCFIDSFQGTVMAKFAYNNLHMRKVAILKEITSDYSVGLAKYFTETFKKLGGTIVTEQSFQRNDIDFKAQLTSIKSNDIDGLYIPGYYNEVGLIASQARQLGIKVTMMGGDGWDSAKLYEIGKQAVVGGYFSNHYTTDSTDPRARDFLAEYKKRYHKSADAMAALGYDAANVLADSMKRAKELTPTAIRDAIATTKDFKAVTGTITINEKRDATKSAVVVQVAGDHNKFVTTIDP